MSEAATWAPATFEAIARAGRSAWSQELVSLAASIVGTALTVDALTGGGEFLGGLIVPGPALMRSSLDRGTAGLRLTEGAFEDFPRSTPDAITSGAIQAGAGAIARLRDAMAARGSVPERILLSGGAAAELSPHLPMPFTLRETLVLDGLVLIAGER